MNDAALLQTQPPAGRIRALVDEMSELICRIETSTRHDGPAAVRASIIANEVAAAQIMNSIGGLADEVQQCGDEHLLAQVREMVCVPLAAWSATSPLFFRVRNTPSTEFGSFEITDLILGNLPSGADVAANVLDHYYLNMMISRAFRWRMQRVVAWLATETARRARTNRSVRVLSLLTGPGWELEQLAKQGVLVPGMQITCADNDPGALRCARQRLRGSFPSARFVRADPREFLHSSASAGETYDIVYTVNLLDQLADDQAQKLIIDCCSKLAPDGRMLLANFSFELPGSERILLAWVMNWIVRCRSEQVLRLMFAPVVNECVAVACEVDPLQVSLLMIAGAAIDEGPGMEEP